jgi:hypothetical protein
MIKTTICGSITDLFPVEHIGERGFKKRIFWLLESDNATPSHYQLEAWGDDVDLPTKFKDGAPVNCHVEIRGKKWEKNGRVGIITTIRCISIFKTAPDNSADDGPF